MKLIPYKAKQFLLVLAKVLIVGLAFFYIFNRLQNDNNLNFSAAFSCLSGFSIAFLLLFTILNWFLEVIKWQNLVASFKTITFYEAMQQTFGSLTAAIFTPNKVGEYGAKVLYFKRENAKRIVVLNFIHNSSQMLVTVLFGSIGVLVSGFKFPVSSLFWLSIGFVVVFVFIIFFRRIEIYGFSIQKLVEKVKNSDRKMLLKTLVLSIFRYFVFSTQFFILLLFFDVNMAFKTAFATIFTMYFLASIVPTIHFLDVVIKGSVAVFLFSNLGVSAHKIIAITSIMWLLNLVLPVVVGSFFVLRFKFK
ncbi:lysylphosphatidylglycerol synthase domain-containing protein [Flavobacterium sp.]|uniref:lysylphosphatidylglycerol synthase domain-containing protein n=1 Tax=Flavobacterium sp. TaxID=239 RepID=UPI003528B9FD